MNVSPTFLLKYTTMAALENSTILQHIQRAICIASIIHNVACLTMFSCNIFISNRNRPTLRIQWLSFFSLLAIVIFSASLLCILYPFGADSISCVYIMLFSTISLTISKVYLYNFFLERLHIINNKSSIQNLNIKLWRIALCLWALFLSTLFIIFSDNVSYNQQQKLCAIQISNPPFIAGILLLGDIVFSASISILLCRALLIAIYQNCEFAKNEHIVLKLLKKMVLLSAIAVISTQLSVIIGVISSRTLGALFTALDSVVNVWCILLSFGHNDKMNKVYDNICGRCHGCFGWKECLLCFACNCCCPISQISNHKNQAAEKEETMHSTTTGVTTTMDDMVSTAQPGKELTITKMMEGSSKAQTESKSKSKSKSSSIKLCIQSTIRLSIGNDGSANVESINVETSVEPN